MVLGGTTETFVTGVGACGVYNCKKQKKKEFCRRATKREREERDAELRASEFASRLESSLASDFDFALRIHINPMSHDKSPPVRIRFWRCRALNTRPRHKTLEQNPQKTLGKCRRPKGNGWQWKNYFFHEKFRISVEHFCAFAFVSLTLPSPLSAPFCSLLPLLASFSCLLSLSGSLLRA